MFHNGINLVLLVTIMGIGAISAILYRSDNDPKTYDGKKIKIPSKTWSIYLIKISFYLTFLSVLVEVFSPDYISLVTFWENDMMKLFGILTSIFGSLIFVTAKIQLNKSYSPCFKSFVPEELVSRGIYRHIRHPIYLGNLVIFLGAYLINGSLIQLAILLSMALLYYHTSKVEEKMLLETLSGYQNYCGATGGFLPRLNRSGIALNREIVRKDWVDRFKLERAIEKNSKTNLDRLEG